MKIIVKKFGGTSLKDTKRIDYIAKHLVENKKEDEGLIIVVSAMGKKTDFLHKLAQEITLNPPLRELDMLLTAGERISMSLLAIALQKYGASSISFTGSQSGIITDTNHGNAKINDVRSFRIKEELKKNKIVIVAGFQGVSSMKEVTTLGRGGSDTTATALACYLAADKCEIYTDVDGVYSADPNKIENAKKIKEISYDDMLIQSYSGASVLHPRSVEFAKKYNIELEIKNSFAMNTKGTIVKKKINEKINNFSVSEKKGLYFYKVSAKESLNNLLKIFREGKIDIFTQNFSDGKFSFFVENNVGIDDLLEENKFEFEKVKNLYSITLAGNHLPNDNEIMIKILDILKKDTRIYFVQNTFSYIRIFFTLQKKDVTYLIKKVHNFLTEV